MKLGGTNGLHVALEARFGEADPYPSYEADGWTLRRRGAWRCPACDPSEFAPHQLTVALDPDGDAPECHNGCSEEAIWRALGGQPPPAQKRTLDGSATAQKRTSGESQKRTHNAPNAHRDETASEGNVSMGVVSKDISRVVAPEEVDSSGQVTASVETSRNEARAHALGVPDLIGSEFPCILPSHEHSARLTATQGGHWLYQCADGAPISLAALRAALDSGHPTRLSAILSCRWLERLDFEARLLQPGPVAVEPPEGCSEATRKVARGLALFLGLRDERWVGEPFTFARNFIVAYCGVTTDEARWAMGVLERKEVIRRDGTSLGSILWRLVEEPS